MHFIFNIKEGAGIFNLNEQGSQLTIGQAALWYAKTTFRNLINFQYIQSSAAQHFSGFTQNEHDNLH